MAIRYKVVSKCQPGVKGGGIKKYYVQPTKRHKVDLRELCLDISSRSTLNNADVVAVVQSLLDIIPWHLREGNSVELGDLGIFTLHVSSEGAEKSEKVNHHRVTGVKVGFRPGVYFKRQLKGLSFKKVR